MQHIDRQPIRQLQGAGDTEVARDTVLARRSRSVIIDTHVATDHGLVPDAQDQISDPIALSRRHAPLGACPRQLIQQAQYAINVIAANRGPGSQHGTGDAQEAIFAYPQLVEDLFAFDPNLTEARLDDVDAYRA